MLEQSKEKRERSVGQGSGYIKYIPGLFRGLTDSDQIVRSIVGRPLLVRKSEQTVNVLVVVPIVIGIVAIPWLYMKILDWTYKQSTNHNPARVGFATIGPGAYGLPPAVNPIITFVPTYGGDRVQPTQEISVKVQVNYPTALPTQEVTVTPTADTGQVFYYSFYNPDMLAPGDLLPDGTCKDVEKTWCHTTNCWDYDVAAGNCRSATASGQKFRDWWNKGLACGGKYPLWTVFIVLEPSILAGRWTCIDRGGIVDGSRLDFLQINQVIAWGAEVHALVELPK